MRNTYGVACAWVVSAGVLLSVAAQPAKIWENHLFERDFTKPVLRYVNAKLLPAEAPPAVESVGYFHPVFTPGGTLVTDLGPKDHPHHRGVFCAWIEIEGSGQKGDFWGWGAKAPAKGSVITCDQFQILPGKPRPGDPWSVSWLGLNHWKIGGTEILREGLSARVWHAAGPKGELPDPNKSAPAHWQAHVLDLRYEFGDPAPIEKRVADVRLGASPFGGFCYRAKPRGKPEFTGPDGKAITLPDAAVVFDKLHKNWPAAKWYDLTYRSDDGKTVSGVAVMDHPSNPKTTWFNHRGLHMVNPCIVAEGPVTLKGTLVLKYRLVVHDGEAASVPLAKLYQDFAAQK